MIKNLSQLSIALICLLTLLTSCNTEAQSEMDYQLTPATGNYFATLTSCSSSNAKLEQHYMKDGAWIKNENIPSPSLSIKGGNYGMVYSSESQSALASLFVYSKNTGEFEFFFLEDGVWNTSQRIPSGKINFGSSKLSMKWVPGTGSLDSYIEAYASNGKNYGIYHVDSNDNQWKKTMSFP